MTPPYRAAWVPDDLIGPDWEKGVATAIDWIENEGERQGVSPIFVRTTSDSGTGTTVLERFADTTVVVTRRSQGLRLRGAAPVFAFAPDIVTFEVAAKHALGNSLCIVGAGCTTGMQTWAGQVGAVEVVRNVVADSKVSDSTAARLDEILFHGNNGWADKPGKRDALRILEDLKAEGELDSEVVCGCMLAHGITQNWTNVSGYAIEQLLELVRRVAAQRS